MCNDSKPKYGAASGSGWSCLRSFAAAAVRCFFPRTWASTAGTTKTDSAAWAGRSCTIPPGLPLVRCLHGSHPGPPDQPQQQDGQGCGGNSDDDNDNDVVVEFLKIKQAFPGFFLSGRCRSQSIEKVPKAKARRRCLSGGPRRVDLPPRPWPRGRGDSGLGGCCTSPEPMAQRQH